MIALDIGSTHLKCGVIAHTVGKQGYYTRVQSAMPLYTKGNNTPDVNRWFLLVVNWLRDLEPGITNDTVAIVICGQAPSLVGVDRSDDVVEPVLLRTLLYDTTYGVNEEAYSYFIPMAFWYKQHHPLRYERVAHFVPIPEYIGLRLSGTPFVMYPHHQYAPYYWNKNTIKGAGLDVKKFPPLAPIGTRVGDLSGDIARLTSLKRGIPLLSGGLDFAMAIIGTNTLTAGSVCDNAGYSEGLNYCAQYPLKHPLMQSLPHIRKGYYNVALIIEAGGRVYERALYRIKRTQPLYTPRAIKTAPRVPRFFHAGHLDLTIRKHKRDNTPLALQLESLFFVQRYFLEEIQRSAPLHIISLCGGQSHYDSWNQMKCNFIGLTCRRMENYYSELIGCAICALYGLGLYPSITKAGTYIAEGTRYTPSPSFSDEIAQRYQEFCQRLIASLNKKPEKPEEPKIL